MTTEWTPVPPDQWTPDDRERVWPSDNHWIDRKLVEELVNRLIGLAETTNPLDAFGPGNPTTAVGKEMKAREAIWLGRHLLDQLTRWAVRHEIGRTLNDAPRYMPPVTGHESEEMYVTAKAAVDDHRHELRGSSEDLKAMLPEQKRLVLAAVVSMIPGVDELGLQLSEALKALNLGETVPLLERANPTAKGKTWTLATLKLKALEHCAFHRGFNNCSDEKSREEIGQRYGMSADTVKGWRAELSQKFGEFLVDDRINWAKACGERCRNRRLSAVIPLRPDMSPADLFFGDEALAKDVLDFHRINNTAKDEPVVRLVPKNPGPPQK